MKTTDKLHHYKVRQIKYQLKVLFQKTRIKMKMNIILLSLFFNTVNSYSQNTSSYVIKDSVLIENRVQFYIYNGPYGDKENIKEPAIKFIITISNKGNKPIPDIDVTNRSLYLNFYINDSVSNPVSMYNGTEITGDHLLKKNMSDTYVWWIFEKAAYGDIFTVQWEYMEIFSNKIKVNVKKRTVENVK